MQNTESLPFTLPSLPSGGGTITGLKGDMAGAGPDGAATLSLPLPVSAGRGYAPSLSLNYHSRSGNGPFGMGWNISLPAIRLRTRKGAPAFDGTDEFTGPDGEVLVPVLNAGGHPAIRTTTTLLGTDLKASFKVYTYRSRLETDFSRLEYWVPESEGTDFWVMYSPDGQVHLLGRSALARISNPAEPSQTALWLPESSVSAVGEQMYYQYRSEDDVACSDGEKIPHAGATAQRYLVAVWYGNKKAARTLPALTNTPSQKDWLFLLTLDHGERLPLLQKRPDWLAPGEGEWLCRQDCFSGYEYGFEVRTRRLCRQVLMYHNIEALKEKVAEENAFELVSRLLLTYNENPSVTTLTSVQQCAYEPEGTLCTLPPLDLSWQTFAPLSDEGTWQARKDMGRLNHHQPYQLVDLNGEGIAGILYQDNGTWWYRSPERGTPPSGATDADVVTWGVPVPLPDTPALRDGGTLTDLNGDGYLEWVVTSPGVAGRYARTPEGWQHFTPLSALPVEYAHPDAQLADILGSGLTDLVLIGPKSVRLYGGTGDGWTKARTVMQSAGITLPVPGTDSRVMVAFSDMTGSGQQHLVEVRASGVRYWPNLGHGRFDVPVSLPGFTRPQETFSPEHLYLADVDGSGTTDLIYALSDHLLVWCNQSGNCLAAPFRVNLPAGVRYDNTCSLQVADIQGLGVASLVLTVPHPAPRHWMCHLTGQKPWLLRGLNNNMGAVHTLHYRSSAQFWLDDKAQAVKNKAAPAVSHLPFALHMLARTEVFDEVTRNRLVSAVRYRYGAWDGREQEFRGFGMVEVTDTDMQASQGTADTEAISMPAITRSWYATGIPAVDEQLKTNYWQGDAKAYPSFIPQFTTGQAENETACEPDDDTAYWLRRGLKGLPLRSELYGADGSPQSDIPYTVTESGLQARLVNDRQPYPVIWPSVVETRTYVYERVHSDPQCSQEVILSSDEYGHPLRTVNIQYPRRPQPENNPYPDTLPGTLFASSYDEQQQALRLTLMQQRWHTLADEANGIRLFGLPEASRQDVFSHPGARTPATGLCAGLLKQDPTLLSEGNIFAGQQRVWYQNTENDAVMAAGVPPVFPPRVAFTETAVLDETITEHLKTDITAARLEAAGYVRTGYVCPTDKETGKTLWSVRQGHATYACADHFYLPVAYRDTLLTGQQIITRDAHDCVITEAKDAAGLTMRAEYDWRFLVPVRITDENDNVHSITLDALGRVTTTRFTGTENGKPAGYSNDTFRLPKTAEDALRTPENRLPVHQCMVYVTDSWQMKDNHRQPPHVVTLATDRYDSDSAQQIRQQVVFSDGFGRPLQTAVRYTPGLAWQRKPDGSLQAGESGKPASEQTDFRWAVSGRTEYDNKGQPVRTYQPYFLNDWQYVCDDSARQDLYADTHDYDPTGREVRVITAKSWLRRTQFTPWFVVGEDENDTATEATRSPSV